MESSSKDTTRAFAITHLLARFVSGEIRDTAWDRFMSVMDSETLSGDDRRALANFFNDALDEFGCDGDIYIPMLSEASNLFDDGFQAAA